MNTPKQLKACFPYMFEGRNIGLSFYKGWFPLFEQLCEDIDRLLAEDKRGFHWIQLKEKFGSARFYFELEGRSDVHADLIGDRGVTTLLIPGQDSQGGSGEPKASLRQQVHELVQAATRLTRERCIVCGEPATLDQSSHHVLMLCEHHARQRRDGNLEPAWFEEDER